LSGAACALASRGGFHFLLWFHILYSQVLLRAARLNLRAQSRKA
jgi:hypothetical protein